jgi:ATP-dependent HslUV protease ATP-binding subunit HslU
MISSSLTPKEIVKELNRFIISQDSAKKCVANALRNRWRRSQLKAPLKDEVLPKNILMIGPTGVGKTEIARRMARLIGAPFIKVEATKFTEVGYVGRDVEQIIRDLVEVAIFNTRQKLFEEVKDVAQERVEQSILTALVGNSASDDTKARFAKQLKDGELESRIIEVQVKNSKSPMFELSPGAQMGMVNLWDVVNKSFNDNAKTKRVTIAEARKLLLEEESEKLLDQEKVVREAITAVEQNGIVFIDEIDKICEESRSGKVSREGVQRDLIPFLEGTSVPTKHGVIKTDHILFIASGAFYISKPCDLLPELQGRFPIRVELRPLTKEDFVRILNEPENNLIDQYKALMAVEGVILSFSEEAIAAIANMAEDINTSVENIGARRLYTLLEKLLEDISFTADEKMGQSIDIDKCNVIDILGKFAKDPDLSCFVL